MNKNMNRIVGLVVILLLIYLGYWYTSRQSQPSDSGQKMEKPVLTGPIKIAFMGPLTGDAASYGESELHAIQVAVDEINQTKISGQPVELVTEDSKCDPQAAGVAAQKMVNIDKIKIIIGGACSGETLAAAKITDPAKIILLSPSASSPDVTGAGDFVFRVYPSDALAGKIKILLTDRNLRERFIESGRRKVFQDFNLQTETDKLLALWSEKR